MQCFVLIPIHFNNFFFWCLCHLSIFLLALIRWGSLIIFFLFLHGNICCGYSLEVPLRGAFNEYLNICLCGEIRKISILSIKKVLCYLVLCSLVLCHLVLCYLELCFHFNMRSNRCCLWTVGLEDLIPFRAEIFT